MFSSPSNISIYKIRRQFDYFRPHRKHYLVRNVRFASDKVSLPGDGHKGPDVSIHGDRLVTVCVPEDDVGDPELANLTTFIEYLLNCHFAFCKT